MTTTPTTPTTPTKPTKPIYADITNRAFAAMLDLCIIYLVVDFFTRLLFNHYYPGGSEYNLLVSKVISQYPALQHSPDRIFAVIMEKYPERTVEVLNQMMFLLGVQTALVGLYIIPMIKIYGATFGKKIIGIRVIDNITGKDLSWSQSVIRYIGYLPSMLFFGLGFITGAITRRKRCWHDFMADTVVVYDENRWYKRQFAKLRKWLNLS